MPGSKVTEITGFLIKYYTTAGRDYPWRKERTPFRVYLSEMLLQRTRADQVEPVFRYLVSRYPDVKTLYNGFEEVKQAIQSLGRNCRLHYFKAGLEYLINNYGGKIPSDRQELLAVPGIGDYITAAIRIFGFGIPDVIVDTNTVRIFCRLYGLQFTPETRRRKHFIELATRHVSMSHCIEYSYGLLDFAAEICRPVRPACGICGLRSVCDYSKINEENMIKD
ncbi:Adenine DNA glycosylase [Moorella thermoacetica]|uniref:hypothetical protein n=1 Tax=Neomoorella thermoacetica TaxID=1525 RepID=UPI0008FA627A|nr:hypothetical protein [Moorella thermoacetica]OIQ10642.1 putative A/G-specific adenine glycosylase YfhQ [Moorella thermoacetica]